MKSPTIPEKRLGWPWLVGGLSLFFLLNSLVVWEARERGSGAIARLRDEVESDKTEIATTKAEIESLRNLVAKLSAETKNSIRGNESPEKRGLALDPSPTHAATLTAAPVKFLTPEQLLRAYLDAPKWQDRIPLVVSPELAIPEMTKYYWAYQVIKGYSIPPTNASGTPVGGSLDVIVTAPTEQIPYRIVNTKEGFKVDWLASQALQTEHARVVFVRKWGLENPVLEVKVLKVAASGSYAVLTIEMTNKSGSFVALGDVQGSVFDANKRFLGHDFAQAVNLGPGKSATSDISIGNVDASLIGSWELKLGGFTLQNADGERLGDAEKFFTLKEVK